MVKTYDELLEAVLEAVNSDYAEDNGNLTEEGANSDLVAIKKQAKTLKKINIKGMKQMFKSGDYAKAKKVGEEILAALDDYEKQFKEVDQSFGSAALGDLMGGALRVLKDLALGLITFGIGPVITIAKRLLSRIIQVQKSAGDKDLDYKMFNSYAQDILTMMDDMKHQVKKVMAKCDEAMKIAGGSTQESADIAYAEYLQNEMDELMTEGMLSNPLRKHLDKLKDIKKKKPAEYDGPEDVKKFVDDNYDEIEKAAELLEKEPKDLRDNQIRQLVAVVLSWLGWVAAVLIMPTSVIAGGIIAALSAALAIASGIVYSIITYCRTSNDRKAMDDLSKIRDALAKIKSQSGDKLPTLLKNKISDLITKIDDAETEINARIKAVKESADDDLDAKLAIYESAYTGEISENDRDELLGMISESSESEE